MFCSEPWLASLTLKWPIRIAGTSACCADLGRERLDVVDHGALEQAVQLGQALALHLIAADQRRAQWVGRRGDLKRLPAAAGDLEHLFAVAHGDVGHIERAEDVDAGRALGDRGQIVVADEHDHRDAGVRDLLDAAGELPLIGRVGIARLVRITGEDEDVHALLDGVVGDVAQPAQEVHDAGVDPRRGVDPPVVFHADVDVGGVEELDGFHVACLAMVEDGDADDADHADTGNSTILLFHFVAWSAS